ncbi:ATP-binding protein [Streptomyces tailanensis]|uniref:ATP-binding protein n=1 Tax=Streptomyces tailanensis TaxID=2569858 RepID=UPI00122DE3F7|nr:ATP-binding protein [Streptomyces tailanensis]
MTSLSTPVQAASIGPPAYSQNLPCEASTAEIGRKLVRDVLAIWNLDHLADSAALIVTELIANATRHTPCREIRLIVGRPSATRVRVGVVDREPSRRPTLSQADDNDESGRGLLLIDAVADRWGYDLHGSGMRPLAKEVWAELLIRGDE